MQDAELPPALWQRRGLTKAKDEISFRAETWPSAMNVYGVSLVNLLNCILLDLLLLIYSRVRSEGFLFLSGGTVCDSSSALARGRSRRARAVLATCSIWRFYWEVEFSVSPVARDEVVDACPASEWQRVLTVLEAWKIGLPCLACKGRDGQGHCGRGRNQILSLNEISMKIMKFQ